MTTRTANRISLALVLAGTLLMMSMAFDILPDNLALYIGLACYVMSGFVYGILRGGYDPNDSQSEGRKFIVIRRKRR